MTVPIFSITRIFDKPRDIVWRAWTDPAVIAQWFGPKGSSCKVLLKHELREGGVLHSVITAPGMPQMCGLFTYREVAPETRLVWSHAFSDEHGHHRAPPDGSHLAADAADHRDLRR